MNPRGIPCRSIVDSTRGIRLVVEEHPQYGYWFVGMILRIALSGKPSEPVLIEYGTN